MTTRMTSKTRNAIASLSTGGVGTYYTSPGVFFTQLGWVLRDNGLQLESEDHPPIHTSDGNGRLGVTMIGSDVPLFDVVYTWHRMPSSNWEMICYPSC